MILKNKKALILSSLLILLPIPVGYLLRDRFSPVFLDSAGFTIWLPPLSLLAGHWLCILATSLDPGNKNRNRKPLTTVLWIIPLLSNLCCGILYALLLGLDFSPYSWMISAFGALFIVIGNYMPKTKMNATMGIKVPWAYSSEENWAATHRFAGKVWVIGGLLMLLGAFLPEGGAIAVMFVLIIALCLLPVLYSRRFYLQEKAAGKPVSAGYSATDRKITKVSLVFLALLLIFIAVLMFTGDLEYRFEADRLVIEADWHSDMTIRYDTVEDLEYREEAVPGYRVGGFQSARLLMGFFSNEEFGTYTRYTYSRPEVCVVVRVSGKVFVLSCETPEQTHALYETLLEKVS